MEHVDTAHNGTHGGSNRPDGKSEIRDFLTSRRARITPAQSVRQSPDRPDR
jgi:hypothetical protein